MNLDADLANAGRLFQLALPVSMGVVAGVLGLFPDPRSAVVVLNRYALYVGFPALVAVGILGSDAVVPADPAFWLLWPCTLGLCLLIARVLRAGPTVGLAITFGNVAYLGLPFVLAIIGPQSAGPAALIVAVHVTGAVTVGPLLLARASAPGQARAALRAVLGMPLFWAPVAGFVGRTLSPSWQEAARDGLAPFADSAAPIALFLLGLYVFLERGRVVDAGRGALGLMTARLLLAPIIAFGLAWIAVDAGWLDPTHGRLHVLLASMPVAITTFSMAHDAEVEPGRVAAGIVGSSLLAVVTLPVWSLLCGTWS